MIEIRKEILGWLKDNDFIQHAQKPNLYMRVMDNETVAYVDFRKVNKGRRYFTKGMDIRDVPDSLHILCEFKTFRDNILGIKAEEPKKDIIVQPAPLVAMPTTHKEEQHEHYYIIERAGLVSKLLSDVVEKAKLYTMIGGKKYVRVDGWETLGALLHCTSEITIIKEYKDGYWAEATIKDKTGATVSRGVGICLRSEKNWEKRDEYAILSMAQTRALGKAYRLGFSWIMNLAGYEPVSSEEMGV